MTRYGPMFGPDITYLGVPLCDLGDPASFAVSPPYDHADITAALADRPNEE